MILYLLLCVHMYRSTRMEVRGQPTVSSLLPPHKSPGWSSGFQAWQQGLYPLRRHPPENEFQRNPGWSIRKIISPSSKDANPHPSRTTPISSKDYWEVHGDNRRQAVEAGTESLWSFPPVSNSLSEIVVKLDWNRNSTPIFLKPGWKGNSNERYPWPFYKIKTFPIN